MVRLLLLVLLSVGCVGKGGQDTDGDCGDRVALTTTLFVDPATGEARGEFPHASLRSLRVLSWGDAQAIGVEVAPGHWTHLVRGADQAGYPPGLAQMNQLRWTIQDAGERAPIVSLRGTCQAGG